MPRPTVMPFKNVDAEPCFVCGATENTRWYCAYDPQQKRRWLCNGNCLQHGSMKRVSDRAHINRANPNNPLNVEATGWTWKPAPKQTPQKARLPPKKGNARGAVTKRKTAVSPRSAGPKKARQPKKSSLIDDEAEDDEDGDDGDEEDEPDSEDRAFIDDDSSQTNDDPSAHRALDAHLDEAIGLDAPVLSTPKGVPQGLGSQYPLHESESEGDSPRIQGGVQAAGRRAAVIRSCIYPTLSVPFQMVSSAVVCVFCGVLCPRSKNPEAAILKQKP